MSESFGARLRQRRERQQIALGTIAEQTKIKLSLLDGLERDDISHWPSGIFRRAFIRTYANAIGLEPDVVVHEFMTLYPDPSEDQAPVPAVPPGAEAVSATEGPPTRLRYLVGSAIDSLSRRRRDAVQTLRPTGVDRPQTDCPPVKATVAFEPDLMAAARMCTELGRVDETRGAAPLLEELSGILGAAGLIVWLWHPHTNELRPALAHGYSDHVLAQLPKLARGAGNATATAFRSAQTCVVDGSDLASGALVVPLLTSVGCVGVLAMELHDGRERKESVRAMATMFAAQLARVVGAAHPLETAGRRLA